jgi:cytochrome P450
VPFDFLTAVAAELPMQAICILLGVPEDDRHALLACVEHAFDYRDGREAFETTAEAAAAHARMYEYGRALIEAKRQRPTDDMLSVVVHATLAEEDPPALSDAEVYAFFTLLFAAGADTTRNAIAGGLLALLEHPHQFGALRAQPALLPTAIEEMLRWTTPSPSKRRTATCDTQLGARAIRPGDKVLVWEGSANRDEQVFARAMELDVRREPNPHLASATVCTSAWAGTWPDWRCASCSRSCWRACRAASWPARSNGRAATATPVFGGCRCGCGAAERTTFTTEAQRHGEHRPRDQLRLIPIF